MTFQAISKPCKGFKMAKAVSKPQCLFRIGKRFQKALKSSMATKKQALWHVEQNGESV